jgi:hypothetical protein
MRSFCKSGWGLSDYAIVDARVPQVSGMALGTYVPQRLWSKGPENC